MLEKPNYTQIPNVILDNKESFSDIEFRVLVFMCRKTFGWHKKRDKIAYSQIMLGTGISKNSIIRAIKSLKKNGFISQFRTHTGYSYQVIVNNDEYPQGVQGVPTQGTVSHLSVPTQGTTKETLLKKLTKENIPTKVGVNKEKAKLDSIKNPSINNPPRLGANPPPTELKKIIATYTELFKKTYSINPSNYSVITKKVKDLLASKITEHQITQALKNFFADPDPFLQQQAHSMPYFASKIARWIVATPKKDIRDGFDDFFDKITKQQKDK